MDYSLDLRTEKSESLFLDDQSQSQNDKIDLKDEQTISE